MTRKVPTRPSAWRLVRPRELVWPVIAGTVTLISALALTVVSAWLITRSWQMPPIMEITVAVTAVRALGISRAAFRYIDRLSAHHVALNAAERSRLALWQNFATHDDRREGLNAHNLNAHSRGEIMNLIGNDIDVLADVIVRSLIPTLIAALTSVLAIGFTALLSPQAAIILAVGLIVAGGIAPYVIYRSTLGTVSDRSKALVEQSEIIEAALSDAASLRIHGRVDRALDASEESAERLKNLDNQTGSAAATASALATAAATLTAIFTVIVGAVLITTQPSGNVAVAQTMGQLHLAHSPEWLTVLVLIPLAAFEAVGAMPQAAQTLARSRQSLRALAENQESQKAQGSYLPQQDSRSDSGRDCDPLQLQPVLRVSNLEVGYSSSTPSLGSSLGSFNFTLPFGGYKEIVAPSGSGKTTLLKTLAGVLPAQSGSVELTRDEASGQKLPISGDGRFIRFIAEDEHIFATTIRDNIAVGRPSVSDSVINSLLRQLHLDEWVAHLPQGLDTVLSDGAASLSGGQRRRLILARALASTAPILLLDEPTEHVDDAAADILALLRDTHRLPGARAERSIILVRHPRPRN